MKKTKQWNLNADELTDLLIRREHRMGRIKLLEALQRQLGVEALAESDWWEALILRLKVPSEFQGRLIANVELGKVWVRGEVKELDDKSSTRK